MIGTALNRTWQQLLHPKFRKVFITAVSVAAVTLALLMYVLYALWPKGYTSGYDWIDETGYWLIVLIGSYALFPAIVSMVMGMLTDQIATAVEEEYYPHRVGTRPVPILDMLWGSLKLMLAMIALNLLALVPYLILFLSTAGTGALILFAAINGYLLGREYFEMVAVRHMPLKEVERMRSRYSGKVFMGGAVTAGLFAIPFLNILAPIIGAAVMTHIFQYLKSGEAQ
ncbi:EI24 domain-containing protein [Kordiimonas marina]|uniref:EI24 domain-containing protein n=1 Tax=Kordiimonas marina TaxID=2872312 RepID=UPI001FF0DFE6|nr:EI24 domain-containing protein [Kordiimonas marina]MCJ9429788.1 EI24 domain-containing protein [Kordiimonas marina]